MHPKVKAGSTIEETLQQLMQKDRLISSWRPTVHPCLSLSECRLHRLVARMCRQHVGFLRAVCGRSWR